MSDQQIAQSVPHGVATWYVIPVMANRVIHVAVTADNAQSIFAAMAFAVEMKHAILYPAKARSIANLTVEFVANVRSVVTKCVMEMRYV